METLNSINPVPVPPNMGGINGANGEVLPVGGPGVGAVPVAGAGALPVGYAAPVMPSAAVPAVPAVPAVGYVAPAVPNTVVLPAAPAVPAGYAPPPPAIPGAPVAGSRLSSVRNHVRTASTSFRNDLPLGTGIYLLKSCKYSVTQGGKHKWSTFSVMCLVGVKDAQDIVYGTHGYNGPRPGETYELGTYQDMSPQAEARTIKNNLIALRMCLGWTEERLKQYQETEAGTDILMGLLAGMFCVEMEGNQQPTGEACCFSNQVVIQISKTVAHVPQLDANKQQLNNADGTPYFKDYENSRWDKKVLIADLVQHGYTPTTLAQAFGSAELYETAKAREAQFLAM